MSSKQGIPQRRQSRYLRQIRKNWVMYLFLLIPVIIFILFKYIPMSGNAIAFRKYVPGKSYFGVSWEGMKYFNILIKDAKFWKVFYNTVFLGTLTLLITFPLPILFALLLNELDHSVLKKVTQSITIIPKFLSTIVVATIFTSLLSPSTGAINNLIEYLGGNRIFFLNEAEWFWFIYIVTDVWQFMGWNSIIYMAALSSADQEQYEAAMVDGASRFKQIIYITLPMLRPTIAINLIIAIGYVFSLGFEKILLLYKPVTYSSADIIQTYVYRIGLGANNYSYGTAIGLFQALISLILLWIANKVINKRWECGLW